MAQSCPKQYEEQINLNRILPITRINFQSFFNCEMVLRNECTLSYISVFLIIDLYTICALLALSLFYLSSNRPFFYNLGFMKLMIIYNFCGFHYNNQWIRIF
ncbi:hypothetical protein FGO68_gene10896 [Halteria grandinella]|uniref:Uncharacterized protein n=1 Tax=Halteria grandinella TaxID=5974 RepID=A0A8J8NS69_HALGN|nr:hypothetical protein FGO68_gene10896 [Halteria grandinella]